jgi:hypothetical protein
MFVECRRPQEEPWTDVLFDATPDRHRFDCEEALDLVMALGPAGEILRLAGDRAAHLHGQVEAALREGLAEFDRGGELVAPASTWIVTASAPSDSPS